MLEVKFRKKVSSRKLKLFNERNHDRNLLIEEKTALLKMWDKALNLPGADLKLVYVLNRSANHDIGEYNAFDGCSVSSAESYRSFDSANSLSSSSRARVWPDQAPFLTQPAEHVFSAMDNFTVSCLPVPSPGKLPRFSGSNVIHLDLSVPVQNIIGASVNPNVGHRQARKIHHSIYGREASQPGADNDGEGARQAQSKNKEHDCSICSPESFRNRSKKEKERSAVTLLGRPGIQAHFSFPPSARVKLKGITYIPYCILGALRRGEFSEGFIDKRILLKDIGVVKEIMWRNNLKVFTFPLASLPGVNRSFTDALLDYEGFKREGAHDYRLLPRAKITLSPLCHRENFSLL